MIHISQKEECCGCHACFTACPTGCIEMVADGEGFLYPLVNEELCANCGICEKVCPMASELRHDNPPVAFAAWHRNAAIRTESSSGGGFSALMRKTLGEGGVVFGAAFDSSLTLCHQSAQNEAESDKLRGSKYVQSIIGNAYKDAQNFLHQGRHVLFSGTPCQVAGLYAFLGNDEENLLTCDLVCHGVPSPKVFAAYKENMERRHGAKVQRISFRRKECGWKRSSVALLFDNATEYRRSLADDPFMLGFLRNTYLRPSCHNCRFSRIPRIADITLGDFWGVGDHHPGWDDDRGTSLILVQTKKGQDAFDAVRDALVAHDAELDVAIRSNSCISGSVPPRQNRAAFFIDLDRLPFEKVIKRYMSPPSLWRRLSSLPRRVVRRLFAAKVRGIE